jgi:hypothetical protein
LQFVGIHVSGVVDYLVRNKEIRLYERLNDQLVQENITLRTLLRDERDRYDEVKAQLDNHLGLVKEADEGVQEIHEPIGGYSSGYKKARKLTLASARKVIINESQVPGTDQ